MAILSFVLPANALYFYMEGRETKCFFEELPKDTLVVGMWRESSQKKKKKKITTRTYN